MAEFDRDQWLFSREILENSPSRSDDVDWEKEKMYRRITCLFIVELGNLLQSGQPKVSARGAVAVSAACMLFHRFYVFQSFKKHNRFIIGATCLFLAMKIEECPRRVDHIITCYCKARQIKNPSQEVLKELREQILVAERIVLHTLCFDFQLEHPIGLCVLKVKTDLKSFVPEPRRVELVNTALNFIRDSNGTLLSLLYSASKIALGAIFLATLQLGINPQMKNQFQQQSATGSSWFELIKGDIDMESLKDICYQIIEVYELQKQHSSSSRTSKWADVDVETVKREVDRLQHPSSQSVRSYAESGDTLITSETPNESQKQQPTKTQTISSSNSDHKRHENSVRDQDEDNDMSEDYDPWDAPPTFRQPSVQVSVYGSGVRNVPMSSPAVTGTPTSLSAQPTPDFLPPPTPDYLPPPTPEYIPPPSSVTEEGRFIPPAPTPDFQPPPDSPVEPPSFPAVPSFSDLSSTSDVASSSRGKVRYCSEDSDDHKYDKPQAACGRESWGSGADAVSPKRARLQ